MPEKLVHGKTLLPQVAHVVALALRHRRCCCGGDVGSGGGALLEHERSPTVGPDLVNLVDRRKKKEEKKESRHTKSKQMNTCHKAYCSLGRLTFYQYCQKQKQKMWHKKKRPLTFVFETQTGKSNSTKNKSTPHIFVFESRTGGEGGGRGKLEPSDDKTENIYIYIFCFTSEKKKNPSTLRT